MLFSISEYMDKSIYKLRFQLASTNIKASWIQQSERTLCQKMKGGGNVIDICKTEHLKKVNSSYVKGLIELFLYCICLIQFDQRACDYFNL